MDAALVLPDRHNTSQPFTGPLEQRQGLIASTAALRISF
jgi:hypothetical protein